MNAGALLGIAASLIAIAPGSREFNELYGLFVEDSACPARAITFRYLAKTDANFQLSIPWLSPEEGSSTSSASVQP